MVFRTKFFVAAGILAAAFAHGAAGKTTVCTITVNSPDEKETFRRNLPADRYDFVELVERGRPDWLASACRKGIQCDVLLISGHFDGGDEFYSDRLDARESLPVDEMERASCSNACPGLFSRLEEVYLFGCNTLNSETMTSVSGEIVRSFVRAGHSPAEAERMARELVARHADSNRDRMRAIFKDVPVIYGFSAKAPLGARAASLLERYFHAGAPTIASGRPDLALLELFAPSSMSVASGATEADVQASFRHDMCALADDGRSAAQKLAFVHEVLDREPAEARMLLDRVERYTSSISPADRRAPPVSQALAAIARDHAARERYLAFARDADQPGIRVRMVDLAAWLGWLTPLERRAEIARMITDRLARGNIGAGDVDLVCTLNRAHDLDGLLGATESPGSGDVGRAAIFACLGNPDASARVALALTSAQPRDIDVARAYLVHHPITDAAQLRSVAARIARMHDPDGQVRALDTLARHRVSDRQSLEMLADLFPVARTLSVQRAIAGILIRSDYQVIAGPKMVRALREKRLKSPDGQDLIDILIRRMQL